jgi:hypothetical protein
MQKLLNLVIRDRITLDKTDEYIVSFEMRADIQNPAQALRDAVSDYFGSGTDEAKKAMTSAGGYFDWSDIAGIPDSAFIKHGLVPLKQHSIDIIVDSKEILMQDESDNPYLNRLKKYIKESVSDGDKDIRNWPKDGHSEEVIAQITARNERIRALLSMGSIGDIKKALESETDDGMAYTDILGEIQEIEDEIEYMEEQKQS